jgi:hypothetical protein
MIIFERKGNINSMKKLLLIIVVVLGIGVTSGAYAQSNPSLQPVGAAAPFGGGGGINPNDIDPPGDPVDTPIDSWLAVLLVAGCAYGFKTKISIRKGVVARPILA